jgi:hypothetical protein
MAGSPTRAWVHPTAIECGSTGRGLFHVRVGSPYTNPAFAGTITALPHVRGFTAVPRAFAARRLGSPTRAWFTAINRTGAIVEPMSFTSTLADGVGRQRAYGRGYIRLEPARVAVVA